MNKIQYLYLRHLYFTPKKRIDFYHMLHTLTTNGVSIQAALKLIYKKMNELQFNRSLLPIIINDLLQKMSNGVPFHRAIERWVPNQETVLFEAAHKDIPRALGIVLEHARHINSIKQTIFGALFYPVMMFIFLIITLLIFSFYIMPNMVKLAPVQNWPPSSYNLYVIANFISHHITALSIASIILAILTMLSLASFTFYPIRRVLDYLPPWNIYKSYSATSFLIAIASSIRLGMSFNSAISQLTLISSPYLTEFLRKMKARLVRGSGFGHAIDVGLFEHKALIILSIFSITNKIEHGFQYIAENGLEEQKIVFVRRGKIFGYGLMAFSAVMIGWIVLAMYGIQSSITA